MAPVGAAFKPLPAIAPHFALVTAAVAVAVSTSGMAELWWLMISHLPSRFSYTKV